MRFFLGATLFVLAFILQVRMIIVFRRMIEDVNGALPKDSQVPNFGPSWLRGKVIKLHRHLFPASTLRRKVYMLWIMMLVSFASALACVIRFAS